MKYAADVRFAAGTDPIPKKGLTMLNSMIRCGRILAAVFCAVLFASCGITPLYYPPVDEKTPEEMLDAEACASLLKTGKLQSEDGTMTVDFSACEDDVVLTNGSSLKDGFEKYAVRGFVTIVDKDKKEKPDETWLPVLILPFRNAGSLYFYLVLDHVYIMEKYKLNPEYIFMTRPYSYILAAEQKDGGWEVGFVQFVTTGLEIKKIAEQAQIDKDGTVLNPPAEVMEMLKDPKNYEIASKTSFLPVKSDQ